MEVGTAAIAMRPVGKHPKYQHHNFADRAEPAYPGANFDNDGFCVVHSTVRLCELREDGRYKIVRKLCYKCGNTAIISKGKQYFHLKPCVFYMQETLSNNEYP